MGENKVHETINGKGTGREQLVARVPQEHKNQCWKGIFHIERKFICKPYAVQRSSLSIGMVDGREMKEVDVPVIWWE
jgi:hypothetical protein